MTETIISKSIHVPTLAALHNYVTKNVAAGMQICSKKQLLASKIAK